MSYSCLYLCTFMLINCRLIYALRTTTVSATVAAVSSDEQEFCQWEMFVGECRHDNHVLLIQSAYYGRFILGGRCIDSSYGRMDCGRDITDIVARNCSARRRCTFPVTSLHTSSSSSGGGSGGACPRDLTAHLLVKYTCLKVTQCETVRQGCSPRSESVKVTSSYGYLVNTHLTDSTSSRHLQCGSASCPWRLHAEPGQRINLTIVHFSVTVAGNHGLSSPDAPVVCHRVAAVREAGAVYRDLTACHDPATVRSHGNRYLGPVLSRSRASGEQRKPIYWSETNSLQLMFYVAPNVYVILRYEASGCASLEASDETRVTHSDDGRLAYVECINSRHSWRLHCAGTVWRQVDPDVSITSCIDSTPALDDNGDSAGIVATGRQRTSYGILVVVGVGVVLGVTVGFSMLLIVMRCVRRFHVTQQRRDVVGGRSRSDKTHSSNLSSKQFW